jgi:hypothetical protein
MFALIQASGLVDTHRVTKTGSLAMLLQLGVQFALSIRRARGAGSAFGTGVVADKNMMFEDGQI